MRRPTSKLKADNERISLTNAFHDFEVNARGSLNLLEAIRAMDDPPPLVFARTNRVYGGLPDVKLRANHDRYEPLDPTLRRRRISEARPPHSPYGCSKGAADQYVVDYARTFGLPACVFRRRRRASGLTRRVHGNSALPQAGHPR